MSFRLKNAPRTFQRATDVILPRVKQQLALVYLDSTVIFRRPLRDHTNHEKQIMSLFWEAGVSPMLGKCSFYTRTVQFLDHITCWQRLRKETHESKASNKSSHRQTSPKSAQFFGPRSVFHRFAPSFARKAKPLNNKLKEDDQNVSTLWQQGRWMQCTD